MKKKLLVTTIVIAMAMSTLIGCGKSEKNDSLQNSKGNEEINSEMLPAEGGSVNEDIDSGEGDMEASERALLIAVLEHMKYEGNPYDLVEKGVHFDTEESGNDVIIFNDLNQNKFIISAAVLNGDSSDLFCSKLTDDNFSVETLEDGTITTTFNGTDINRGNTFSIVVTETAEGEVMGTYSNGTTMEGAGMLMVEDEYVGYILLDLIDTYLYKTY